MEHSASIIDDQSSSSEQVVPLGNEYPISAELRKFANEGDFVTLPELFDQVVAKHGSRPYVGVRTDEEFIFESYAEVQAKMHSFASALVELGLQVGQRVANFSNNRPEWPVVDFGTCYAGGVHVPMYATLSQSEMTYIVNDSGATVVVAATEDHLRKVIAAEADCPNVKHIVCLSPVSGMVSTRRLWTWNEFLEYGRIRLRKNMSVIKHRADGLHGWDVASLVYTSGTTGEPKGAMLMHGNFCSQAYYLADLIQASCADVQLSFLPLAHVFERVLYYIMTSRGACIGYTQGIHTLLHDLMILRPTLMPSVPVLFGKAYARVTEKLNGIQNKSFNWALKVGRSYRVAQRAGRVSKVLRAKQEVVRRTVFSSLHKRTGGKIRYFISGGAPLSRQIGEFFLDVGLPILEGYGLTETAPVLTLNPSDAPRLGSVGKVVPGVEVKIDSDGEILARGPNIMRGYFGQPEATKAAFDEAGWFHTGDIGYFDEDGYLFITDRKKEVLVLNNGKNVAPSAIEQAIMGSPYISQVVLVGNDHPFVGALVVPQKEKVGEWLVREGLMAADGDIEEALVTYSQKVYALLMSEVRDACRLLSNYEKVKKIVVLGRELSLANGELTHSMKVKHRVVEAHFAEDIAAMYA